MILQVDLSDVTMSRLQHKLDALGNLKVGDTRGDCKRWCMLLIHPFGLVICTSCIHPTNSSPSV